jgi:phospholipase C
MAATDAGFYGNNPGPGTSIRLGPGWGCNSRYDAQWIDDAGNNVFVPSCIPDTLGRGPYRPSPVPYEPTIVERMEQAGLSWKLYSAEGPKNSGQGSGYLWAPCTYFYTCFNTLRDKWVPSGKFDRAAETGKLPKLSLITPRLASSQHNGRSMAAGDNWIGALVSAVMNGPQWLETTIFITWDDPGGFYDHVPPPAGRGIRIPMVIVSPYAKAGFTDHTFATYASMLAYIEHTFGLNPLTSQDANAYDFSNSFDYTQVPIGAVRNVIRRIPPWEERYMKAHPVDEDDVT